MELLYVYIENYRNLVKREFNLSGNFKFKLENETLHNTEVSPCIPEDFFGERINNVTVLIGENGSGKTTFFRFLTTHLVAGNYDGVVQFLAVFRNVDNQCQDDLKPEFKVLKNGLDEIKLDFQHEIVEEPLSQVHTISYTPYSALDKGESILLDQIGNWINLSDIAMLRGDFESQTNKDRRELDNTSFIEVANLMRTMNIKREVELMANPIYKKFRMPHYIATKIRVPSESLDIIKEYFTNYNLATETDQRGIKDYIYEIEKIVKNKNWDEVNRPDTLFFLTLIIEVFSSEVSAWFQSAHLYQSDIEEHYKSRELVLNSVLEWLREVDFINDRKYNWLDLYASMEIKKSILFTTFLTTLRSNLPILMKVFSGKDSSPEIENYVDGWKYRYLFLTDCQKQEEISDFNDLVRFLNSISRYTRPFVFEYLDSHLSPYIMSAGESLNLKLYSRLLSSQVWDNVRISLDKKTLVLALDETDMGLHPRWQQSFISDLLKFLNELLAYHMPNDQLIKAQVILATHSPIFLSDIPSSNIVWLSTNSDKLNPKGTSGFAGNIFDLFNDNFFLDNTYIGAFAKSKIDSLISYLSDEGEGNNKEWDRIKARQVINLISEDILRLTLEGLFDDKFRSDDPDWIQRRIEELIRLQNRKSIK